MQWDRVSEGVPSSYLGTCISGFPNFFIMMGPNTLSGHLSVIYTTECQINLTLRIIKPILNIIGTETSILASGRPNCDIVTVKPSAEKRDIEMVQQKAKKLVWATGCISWFIGGNTKRNTIMFPDWQYKFWLRSIFVSWDDFAYRTSATYHKRGVKGQVGNGVYFGTVMGVIVGIGALYFNLDQILNHAETAKKLVMSLAR